MAMRSTLRWGFAIILALSYLLGPGASQAHAYIDPGTGSTLLSSLGLLLGATCTVLAFGFAQIRNWGGRVVARLAARRPRESHSEESPH